MTVLELLNKMVGGSLPSLIALLDRAAEHNPDLIPLIRQWKDALGSAATSTRLTELAAVIVAELGQIAQGKIKPTDRPSDAI